MDRIPQNWLARVPPVTRTWTLSAIIMTILLHTKVVSLDMIVFSPDFYKKKEYWRLFTPLLYFGEFNLNLILIFSNIREQFIQMETSFDDTVNFLWFLLINYLMILGFAMFVENPLIFGTILFRSLCYYSCMKNPEEIMALWGIIPFKSAYYAPVNLVLGYLTNDEFIFVRDVLWLITGHVLFYFEDVWGKLHGFNPLKPFWKWTRSGTRV